KAIGLEHKMGLHGSPTCTMAYGEDGECVGYLLGEENRGMACMFTMMNAARLDVGLQGVGVAEGAFQQALAYAQERRQGRAPGRKDAAQSPIIDHPDVRRMLYTIKTYTEASRAVCYANAVAYDLAKHAPDEGERARAKGLEELLTPISKAWSTDLANETTSLGVQVHGGMGYIEETGAAQFLRDARIAAIYEGTNGIQAIDLVGRKLPMEGGALVRGFIEDARRTAASLNDTSRADLQEIGARLGAAADALSASSEWLLEALPGRMEDALAGATPYLRQFGLVAGGRYLGRGALAAAKCAEANEGDGDYYRSKVSLARFYAANLLSQADALTGAVVAGGDAVAPIDPEALAG
ncbi:MAG: acyl-CoA dehydrogenase, partial [Pseudomonadota bacterium]